MADRLIQRCVFPADRRLGPLYYRLDRPPDERLLEPGPPGRTSIRIERGWKLITDTYFNTFFEAYWRRYTRLSRLRLRVVVSGRGTVLLVRRSLAAGLCVLESVDFDGDDAEVVLEVPGPRFHHRELGAVHFDVVARSDEVLLRKAEWLADDADADPVRLVAGYCTFNRERFLLDNVRAVLADPSVAEVLGRIVVVDQGTSKVRDHPDYEAVAAIAGDKLQVVEQGNFGGTGGFTRAILEARDRADATHMLLMDDDAVTEPESILRAASLLAMAREDLAVGGQMLDLLRPLEVYEAGGMVDAGTFGIEAGFHRHHVGGPESLVPFQEVHHAHYNAWWFFAFPLRLVDRVGLPLPFFLRGDDVEFGYRLHASGIPTVTVPGIGVWHEPFYLKRGGWQPYYDVRNMLALTAIHFATTPRQVVRFFLRRLMIQLLSLDYYEATILCDSADHYCDGPGVLEADPRAIHGELVALRRRLDGGTVPRSRCLPVARPPMPFGSKARQARHFLRCLLRQFTRPSPPADTSPGVVLHADHARWWSLALADVVAVEDWHAEDHRVFRRSRETFVRTFARGLKSAWRLYRSHRRAAGAWRAAVDRLSSDAFWRRHLGIDRDAVEADGRDDPARRAA